MEASRYVWGTIATVRPVGGQAGGWVRSCGTRGPGLTGESPGPRGPVGIVIHMNMVLIIAETCSPRLFGGSEKCV